MYLEGFRKQWGHVNDMTLAFVDAVPDGSWNATPHARFAPFAKQVRHVIGVRGVYAEGVGTSRIGFSRKHQHYDGSLERPDLEAALLRQHESLLGALDALTPAGAESWSMDFFGQQIDRAHYTYKIIQHESIHHGEWSLYAAIAGFDTPRLWRVNWGL